MATLVNRDWYTVNASGLPVKVRCLSQNYVSGTVRAVTDDGVFAEIDARRIALLAGERVDARSP